LVRMKRRLGGDVDALVLDARLRQALVSLRSIGEAGGCAGAVDFVGADLPPAFRSRWCAFHGSVRDLRFDPPSFVDDVMDYVDRYRPRMVIPSHDGTIAALRAHRVRIEAQTWVALPSEPSLDLMVDRTQTFAVAARAGVAVPPSVLVSNVDDLPAESERLLPAVVKPVESWVDRGGVRRRLACRCVIDEAELHEAVGELTSEGGGVVVQPWLSGAREAVSVFRWGGRIRARFAQVAWRTSPALGGYSVFRESIALPADITAAADALADAVELDGYAEVEFRRDAQGRPFLMEINPRLSASVEVAVRAGVDFPRYILAAGSDRELPRDQGYRIGTRMRWLGGDLRWLRECLHDPGRPDVPSRVAAATAFIRTFGCRSGYDYMNAKDPWPAVAATVSLARDAWTRSSTPHTLELTRV
jgi:predicted ATP-grasp superfamily ATP-dependent carboligase